MKKDTMEANIIGNVIKLSRRQWENHKAYISNYPGLLNEVLKYTWTYTRGDHPYLQCSKLGVSLHKFVLSFLYGQDKLEQMLHCDHIIEHLDNDGLNCAYDNLHILSSDLNKAKAFTIDKQASRFLALPIFITDVYYSHNCQYYQMQIIFNRNIYFDSKEPHIPIEAFYLQYRDFQNLFIDWLYIIGYRKDGQFDIDKFHADKLFYKTRPQIPIAPEEADRLVIERDGKLYLTLCMDDPNKVTIMIKSAYVNLEQEVDATEESK